MRSFINIYRISVSLNILRLHKLNYLIQKTVILDISKKMVSFAGDRKNTNDEKNLFRVL
jgi:hypothetical protein